MRIPTGMDRILMKCWGPYSRESKMGMGKLSFGVLGLLGQVLKLQFLDKVLLQ